MRRGRTSSARIATLLATLATLAAAPTAAQMPLAAPATTAAAPVSPRAIAASAHAALLMIRALDANGDTLGLGTGFLVGPDGEFVTNYHVIQEAAQLRVKLLEGGEYTQVSLLAADPASDLALMRVPAQGLHPLRLGHDTQMEVGDRVFVMGNPLGMSGTFTDGMVSGKRPLEGVAMLQISAPISPGSSGGPVMNERGEVIGVATMMVMGGQNLNMAVPIRYLQPMLAARSEPRPFSPEVLVANPHAGLALVGDGDSPSDHPESGRRETARPPQEQVQDQLSIVGPMLRLRGFVPAFPVTTGQVARDQDAAHEFRLERGVSYIVTARCDAGCSDVNLAVLDPAEHVLQRDDDRDDFPTIGFVPRETGTYHVAVRIAQCAAPACTYGVAVFRRDPQMTGKRASTGR